MTRLTLRLGFIAALASCRPTAPPAPAASLQELFDRGEWFDLRDAANRQPASPLIQGAVASAFNRVADAERSLNAAIEQAGGDDERNAARGWLARLYLRQGRSAAASRLIDEIGTTTSDSAGMNNVRAMFDAYADRPDQTVFMEHSAHFPCDVTGIGVHMPMLVNGKPATWLLDTGANVTVVSQAEAALLGIVANTSRSKLDDLAGGTTTVRTGRTPQLVIGGTELRNVPVVIVPDGQPPFNDRPPGKRGIIGLPVALALRSIAWTKHGTCRTGPPDALADEANLAFNDFQPLIRVAYDDRPLDFVFDTGNQAGTQLWERFGREFSALIQQRGTKGLERVTQFGGSNEREVTVIPELPLRVGGRGTLLKPAKLFSKPVGDDQRHGNLGMDVLAQADEVIIDFTSMSATLH